MTERRGLVARLSSAFRRKAKVDLIVGLDFGTSSTKAAYRELGTATRRIVPIVFEHGLKTYPAYCLPSVGFVTSDRQLVWGPEAVERLRKSAWSEGIRRLKVLVAGNQNPAFRDESAAAAYDRYLRVAGLDPKVYRPEYLAAAAIAQQMHVIRGLLARQYRGAELDIRFNVCVPIDHMEHAGMLGIQNKINHVAEEIYRSMVNDGGRRTALVEIAAAKFGEVRPEPGPDDRLYSMPEAMAQIASYLMSMETIHGIHAVIDIGAGTTDLSIFNLMGTNIHERACYWYAARNVPRGTGYIEAAIARCLKAQSQVSGIITESDVLTALMNAVPKSALGVVIRDEVHRIWDALRQTWTEGYARHYKQQTAWESIPIFICGGGAKLVGVEDVFAKAWVPNFKRFRVRKLPVPDDYNDRRGLVPFDRLSVAYGLTFLGPELGEFTLPADSPNHTPPLRIREMLPPWTDMEPG